MLDMLSNVAHLDLYLMQTRRMPSLVLGPIISDELVTFLDQLFAGLKDRLEHRGKIMQFLFLVLSSYDTGRLKLRRVPEIMTAAVAHHRLSHSFEGNSLLMTGLRSLLVTHQRRLIHIDSAAATRQLNDDLDE